MRNNDKQRIKTMREMYEICNITPIDIEYLEQVHCYATSVTNLWQANYIWVDKLELYLSIYREYTKDEILNTLYTKELLKIISEVYPKKHQTKSLLVHYLIDDINDVSDFIDNIKE
jgi:hypothetical protein